MTQWAGGSLSSVGTQATMVPGSGSKKGSEKVSDTFFRTYSRLVIEPVDEKQAGTYGNDNSRNVESPEVSPGPVVFRIINNLLFLDVF